MNSQLIFYRERAAEARAGAIAATLANSRDRWLVAEASWMHLAERTARSEQLRDTRESGLGAQPAATSALTGPRAP